MIEQIVRTYCRATGSRQWAVWASYYEEVRRRLKFDVVRRFENAKGTGRYKYKLDVIRAQPAAFHDSAYALAVMLLLDPIDVRVGPAPLRRRTRVQARSVDG